MIVVGVTGSLASGKSEVAKIFKKYGAQIFDADRSARAALQKGRPAHRAVFKIFGPSYFSKNGTLDRRKLADHVFKHPRDLKKLNILIHPRVIVDCFQKIERVKNKKGVLVLDVPLLFESHMGTLADWTVLVGAGLTQTLKRVKKKGLTEPLAKKILSTQWSFKKKSSLADFVIQNNGSLKDLEKKVREIMQKIKERGQKQRFNKGGVLSRWILT